MFININNLIAEAQLERANIADRIEQLQLLSSITQSSFDFNHARSTLIMAVKNTLNDIQKWYYMLNEFYYTFLHSKKAVEYADITVTQNNFIELIQDQQIEIDQ